VFLDSGSTCEVIGGFSLLVGYGGGLYWLVPTIFICLVWGLLASWQLIVMVPEEEKRLAGDESGETRRWQ
jgi:hypothetical protein